MVAGLAVNPAVAAGGLAITVVEPVLLASCAAVAVTVMVVAEEIELGGVSRPDPDMVPAEADQFTVELKLPVPVTVAEHWLVWPDGMVAGEQVAITERTEVTEVLVREEAPPLFPPQLPMISKPAKTETNATKKLSSRFLNWLLDGRDRESVAH
jgi:hypothetical protein